MIRFHHHAARAAKPRLGIRVGDPLVHVFSDLADLAAAEAELRAWAAAVGRPGLRVQARGQRRQHLDVWGRGLAACGPPSDRETVRRWLRGDDDRAGARDADAADRCAPHHAPASRRTERR